MDKIIIYLTNLTHIRDGRPSSEAIPLNIGYLASYLLKHLSNDVEIEIFNIPDKLEEAIKKRVPHVLACSNYIWNSHLNYAYLSYYKSLHPQIVTIMGGPNYPGKKEMQENFLRKFNKIDFYIYREGEITLLSLIRKLLSNSLNINLTKQTAIEGCHFMQGGEFCDGGKGQRIKNPDDIPSPYLSGIFDEMLKDGFAAMVQTNRGCPFTCAYCHSSSDYYSHVFKHSPDRVKDDIKYIARIAKSKLLHIADDNFGLFTQDTDIALTLKECENEHNWPLKINLSTAKTNYERVFNCVSTLGETLYFSAAMQSLNKDTLFHVKRKNLSLPQYSHIINNLKKYNVRSLTEFILGLPAETKESHLNGLKTAIDADIDIVESYTCMSLPNTPLRENEYFDQFKMVKKYRVIPRDFGTYLGRQVLEVEQVCVASASLGLDEYADLRGFHFVLGGYYNSGVIREVITYLKRLNINVFDWLKNIHLLLNENDGIAGRLYKDFLNEAKAELWDSEEEVLSYYGKNENFQKLINGKAGANLLQKYQAVFLENLSEFLEIASASLKNIRGIDHNAAENLIAFCLAVRGDIFDMDKLSVSRSFDLDIPRWITNGISAETKGYVSPTRVNFFLTQEQRGIIEDYFNAFGSSADSKGKILTRINPVMLYRKYEYDKKLIEGGAGDKKNS
ncbi:MAG: radical SAM protein [Nitrospirae bacterium]|nr:radical SAM protein [Nitrospirota bacterium]